MDNKEAQVFDFQAFKARKAVKGDRKIGVVQSFKAEEVTSRVPVRSEVDGDLSARIERIKSSISRINELMAELKTMSPKSDPKN